MNRAPRCWCGTSDFVRFSSEYVRCPTCETLVIAQIPGPEISQVTNDERDFYGREYWFSHQERDLGYPNILARSRTDLPERCLYWLRTVLKYKLPPAQVLELGSAHGGFVALLRLAAFEAAGLEVSPWVVEFARRTFSVPTLLGSVETQQIEPASLDMIALMDVLEHLPNPASTMRHCLSLLKPDGVLMIQTPRYPEGMTYDEMVAQGDCFLEQLKEKEHLYLFSQRSIREFFRQMGANHLQFEPAIFAHYDMFVFASKKPLEINSQHTVDEHLLNSPHGRVVVALLDLYRQSRQAEADLAARLEVIQTIEAAAQERLQKLLEALAALKAERERVRSLEANLAKVSVLLAEQKKGTGGSTQEPGVIRSGLGYRALNRFRKTFMGR